MKKLLALLLALAVSFSLAIPAFAANTALDGIEYDGYTVLSNCSDDELLAFLRENDIAIPDGLADSQEHLLELVRYFIAEIELNPNIEFIYNLAQLQDFAYALKFAVNDFYDVDSSIQPFANYGLQDSTVYQTPSNMTSYNCYAYALGRSSWCSPGELSGHGDMTQSYTGNNYHSGSKHYYEYADICTGCGDQKANTTTWSVINCSGPPCIDIMNVGITQ